MWRYSVWLKNHEHCQPGLWLKSMKELQDLFICRNISFGKNWNCIAGNDCGLAIGLAFIARQAPKPKPNMVTEDEDNN